VGRGEFCEGYRRNQKKHPKGKVVAEKHKKSENRGRKGALVQCNEAERRVDEDFLKDVQREKKPGCESKKDPGKKPPFAELTGAKSRRAVWKSAPAWRKEAPETPGE